MQGTDGQIVTVLFHQQCHIIIQPALRHTDGIRIQNQPQDILHLITALDFIARQSAPDMGVRLLRPLLAQIVIRQVKVHKTVIRLRFQQPVQNLQSLFVLVVIEIKFRQEVEIIAPVGKLTD